ncbi:hypothetical protein ACP8HI_08795 [Paenibacillus sp. FA6]|uniref:hypothetical protein n=1 Tax=Paenibacillus sp. FA6 TaxID=3413029 RepID=UPI003F658AD4
MIRIFNPFLLILIFVFIIGCNNKEQTTSTSNSWAFNFIKWNNIFYKETDKWIEKVDIKIGSVETLVTDVVGKHDGTYSNKFKVGTEIYSIVGIDTDQAIAVEISEGIFFMLIESSLNKEEI